EESFLHALLQSPGLGVGAIDEAVKQQVRSTSQAGSAPGFDQVFKDWAVANILNNASIAGGRYSYPEGGRAQPGRVLKSYPATRSETVHQYAAEYIKLSGNLGPATISFKGNPTAKVIAADPHSGQAYWYSNRRDSGDATLTRELDLTGVRKATLQFCIWYDIEDAVEYAYLEVSSDGGRSWTPQEGKYTTPAIRV